MLHPWHPFYKAFLFSATVGLFFASSSVICLAADTSALNTNVQDTFSVQKEEGGPSDSVSRSPENTPLTVRHAPVENQSEFSQRMEGFLQEIDKKFEALKDTTGSKQNEALEFLNTRRQTAHMQWQNLQEATQEKRQDSWKTVKRQYRQFEKKLQTLWEDMNKPL